MAAPVFAKRAVTRFVLPTGIPTGGLSTEWDGAGTLSRTFPLFSG
jgi:hypothetical protein